MKLTIRYGKAPSLRAFGGLAILISICLLATGLTSVASAQSVENLEQIKSDAVLARLSDAEIRGLVAQRLKQIESLENNKDKGFDPSVVAMQFQQNFGKAQMRLREILSVRNRIHEEFENAWVKIAGPRQGSSFGQFLLAALIALSLGWVAEKLSGRFLNPMRETLTSLQSATTGVQLSQRLARLASVFAVRVASISIFSVVTVIIYFGEVLNNSRSFRIDVSLK